MKRKVVCWAKGHQVVLPTMVGMLSISFGTLDACPLDSPFLGGSLVVCIQPVIAGSYISTFTNANDRI